MRGLVSEGGAILIGCVCPCDTTAVAAAVAAAISVVVAVGAVCGRPNPPWVLLLTGMDGWMDVAGVDQADAESSTPFYFVGAYPFGGLPTVANVQGVYRIIIVIGATAPNSLWPQICNLSSVLERFRY